MKTKFYWTDKENIEGKIVVSENNPEEMQRFYTRFKHDMRYKENLSDIIIEKGDEDNCLLLRKFNLNQYSFYNKNDTQEEYIRNIEKSTNYLITHTDYNRDTNTTLMNAIVEELKSKGLYDRFQKIYEYYLPETYDVTELTSYQFDFVAYVNYGSEGTWLNCYLNGIFDDNGSRNISMGTFKTLHEDREASLVLGELGGAATYTCHKYVNRNIDRY